MNVCINLINIAESSVEAYILGEHGESQFPAWSCAQVGGRPIDSFEKLTPQKRKEIAQETRDKASKIIACRAMDRFARRGKLAGWLLNTISKSGSSSAI